LYIGGGNYEEDGNSNIDKEIPIAAMATASYGYQFGPYFYLGLGTGINFKKLEKKDPYKYLPIFWDLRFNASRSVNTWYAGLKFGTALSLDNYHQADVEESLLIIPSVGYSFGNLNIGAYFMHNAYKVKSNKWSSGYGKSNVIINTWGVNLGLRL
jgi:hypothetical protein